MNPAPTYQFWHPSLPPSSLAHSNEFLKTTQDALQPLQEGHITKSICPLAAAVAVFRKKPFQPWFGWSHPGTYVLKLCVELMTTKNLQAIQQRMGTNGLCAFTFLARVPSVPFPLCSCGWGWHTIKHVLIVCPWHAGVRHELRNEQGQLPDFLKLLGTIEGLWRTT
jgi:hypothetical protein